MSAARIRTHVVLPTELVAEVDALVGARKRSQFIREAVEARLLRDRQLKGLEIGFGAWNDEDHPELCGPEGTEGWIRQLREESNQRLTELVNESPRTRTAPSS
jgi:hypothetical protein